MLKLCNLNIIFWLKLEKLFDIEGGGGADGAFLFFMLSRVPRKYTVASDCLQRLLLLRPSVTPDAHSCR